ncbi:EAL domain-containing protein [bacterium]|nr:EAL domain-containing protein [bacterium]
MSDPLLDPPVAGLIEPCDGDASRPFRRARLVAAQIARQVERLSRTLAALPPEQVSEALWEWLLREASLAVAWDCGWVHVVEPLGDKMVVAAATGAARAYLGEGCAPGQGVSGAAWLEAGPVRVSDYRTWEGRAVVVREGMCGPVIAVPVSLTGGPIAVIAGSRDDGPPFSVVEEGGLETLCQIAARAWRRLVPDRQIPPAPRRPAFLGLSDPLSAALLDCGTAVALIGTDLRFIAVNSAFAALLGYEPDSLRGVPFSELTHPGDRAESIRAARTMLSGTTRSARFRKRYLHRDGGEIEIDLSTSLITDRAGAPTMFLTVVQPAVDDAGLDGSSPSEEARTGPRVVLDRTGRLRAMNGEFASLMEVPPEVVLNGSLRLWDLLHPAERLRAEMVEAMREGRPRSVRVEVMTWAGEVLRLSVSVLPSVDTITLALGVLHLAGREEGGGFESLLREIQGCQRDEGGGSLFIVRVTNARALTRMLGVSVSRDLPVVLRQLIAASVCDAGVHLVYFDMAAVVLAPGTSAVALYDELQAALATAGLGGHALTLACGSAPIERDVAGTTISARAMASVDRNEEKGGPPVFDTGLHRSMTVEGILVSALAESTFEGLTVAFQPIVEVGGAGILAVEALARWVHPQVGAISPAEFLPAIRTLGRQLEFAGHVETVAMQQFANLSRMLPHLDGLRLSVNVETTLLQGDAWADGFLSRAEVAGLRPEQLQVEVLEEALDESVDDAVVVLGRLRSLGVFIAIDDFGAGHSSLSRLAVIGADCVKLDRSLLFGALDRAGQRETIFHAAVALCATLGATVVAEGVEESQQHAFVRSTGSRFGQGYLYGHPMPVQTLEAWLRDLDWKLSETT